jgi:hypothetical protein
MHPYRCWAARLGPGQFRVLARTATYSVRRKRPGLRKLASLVGGLPPGTGSSRSAPAVPGPDLLGPDNADQLLSRWQEAFEEDLGTLDDVGGAHPARHAEHARRAVGRVVFPVLELLYRRPDDEWLGTGRLMSSLGADADDCGTSLRALLRNEVVRFRPLVARLGYVA